MVAGPKMVRKIRNPFPESGKTLCACGLQQMSFQGTLQFGLAVKKRWQAFLQAVGMHLIQGVIGGYDACKWFWSSTTGMASRSYLGHNLGNCFLVISKIYGN